MKRAALLLALPLLTACTLSSTPTPPPATLAVTPLAGATATSIAASPPGSPLPPTGTASPAASATPAQRASFPDPAGYTWASVAEGLDRPLDIQNAGDGSGRLFIVEQPGRILVYQNGSILPTPFLDVVEEVGSSGSEQGLLGLAFHPDYSANGLFFVNYTDRNGDTVISRFHVSGNPNVADAGSETTLLALDQPFANHNGGVLTFGRDGYLYAGLGDGGSGGDPFGNAQNTGIRLGKILRMDVNSGDPYSIPADNPFGNEVWAYGLRNPWRLSFDRLTGDMYIGDVGQDNWEEIDFLPAGSAGGANFGWNIMEGNHPYAGGAQSGLIPPVADYAHSSDPGGCSVTGGYVYRGQALPEWQGIYLYGDYCSGAVWGLARIGGQWQSQVLFRTDFRISSFGVDEAEELYLADLKGAIYRLEKK